MAQYTIELSEVVKAGTNLMNDNVTKVFNFDYTFYDNAKKDEFETKFLNHFRFREIGTNTFERFQHYLKCKCDEVLPFYNMLFTTALINYEKTVNYNLSDTYTREVSKNDTVTANTTTDGNKADTTTNTNSTVRDANIVVTDDKTNTLDSTTGHTESIDFTKSDTQTENGTTYNSNYGTENNKKVESDTPNALLSMSDISSNVYASKANIDDNIKTNEDVQDVKAEKTNTTNEGTDRTTSDTVNATSTDTGTVTTHDDTTETAEATLQNNGTYTNITDATQDTSSEEIETSTRIMRGSYGVITEADMLKKHIELQQTLSTIERKFFEECDDLFMQIF